MKCVLVIATTLLCCAIADAQTHPSDSELARQEALKRLQVEASNLPVLPADSIPQVARLTVVDGMLDCYTSLSPIARESVVTVPGLHGIVRFSVFGPRGTDSSSGYFFRVLDQDLTSPDKEVFTLVSAYAGRFILSRDSESDDWIDSVQLIQDAPPAEGARIMEPPVRLYISHTHQGDATEQKKINLAANSFTELRADHPQEVDQYIRPIARDLQQERALFSVPDNLAWQVLGGKLQADQSILDQIQPLVKKLDADDFPTRSEASEQLKKMGAPVVLALRKLDQTKLSIQQKSEIAAILNEASPLPGKSARSLIDDRQFLIDVLYTDDKALRNAAIRRLATLVGRQIEVDLDATSRENTVAQLRTELVPTTQPAIAPGN